MSYGFLTVLHLYPVMCAFWGINFHFLTGTVLWYSVMTLIHMGTLLQIYTRRWFRTVNQ